MHSVSLGGRLATLGSLAAWAAASTGAQTCPPGLEWDTRFQECRPFWTVPTPKEAVGAISPSLLRCERNQRCQAGLEELQKAANPRDQERALAIREAGCCPLQASQRLRDLLGITNTTLLSCCDTVAVGRVGHVMEGAFIGLLDARIRGVRVTAMLVVVESALVFFGFALPLEDGLGHWEWLWSRCWGLALVAPLGFCIGVVRWPGTAPEIRSVCASLACGIPLLVGLIAMLRGMNRLVSLVLFGVTRFVVLHAALFAVPAGIAAITVTIVVQLALDLIMSAQSCCDKEEKEEEEEKEVARTGAREEEQEQEEQEEQEDKSGSSSGSSRQLRLSSLALTTAHVACVFCDIVLTTISHSTRVLCDMLLMRSLLMSHYSHFFPELGKDVQEHLSKLVPDLCIQLQHIPVVAQLGIDKLVGVYVHITEWAVGTLSPAGLCPSTLEASRILLAIFAQMVLVWAVEFDLDGHIQVAIVVWERGDPLKRLAGLLLRGVSRALNFSLELCAVIGSQVIFRTVSSGNLWGNWRAEQWETFMLEATCPRGDEELGDLVSHKFLRAFLALTVVRTAVFLPCERRVIPCCGIARFFDVPDFFRIPCVESEDDNTGRAFQDALFTLFGVWAPHTNWAAHRIESRAQECAGAMMSAEQLRGESAQSHGWRAAVALGLRRLAARSVRLGMLAFPFLGYAAKLMECFGDACAFWVLESSPDRDRLRTLPISPPNSPDHPWRPSHIHPSVNWVFPPRQYRRRFWIAPDSEWKVLVDRPFGDLGPPEFVLVPDYGRPLIIDHERLEKDGVERFRYMQQAKGTRVGHRALPWLTLPRLSVDPWQGLTLLIDVLVAVLVQCALFNWWALASVFWPIVGFCFVRSSYTKTCLSRTRGISKISQQAPAHMRAFILKNHGLPVAEGRTLSDLVDTAVHVAMYEEERSQPRGPMEAAALTNNAKKASELWWTYLWGEADTAHNVLVQRRDCALVSKGQMKDVLKTMEALIWRMSRRTLARGRRRLEYVSATGLWIRTWDEYEASVRGRDPDRWFQARDEHEAWVRRLQPDAHLAMADLRPNFAEFIPPEYDEHDPAQHGGRPHEPVEEQESAPGPSRTPSSSEDIGTDECGRWPPFPPRELQSDDVAMPEYDEHDPELVEEQERTPEPSQLFPPTPSCSEQENERETDDEAMPEPSTLFSRTPTPSDEGLCRAQL